MYGLYVWFVRNVCIFCSMCFLAFKADHISAVSKIGWTLSPWLSPWAWKFAFNRCWVEADVSDELNDWNILIIGSIFMFTTFWCVSSCHKVENDWQLAFEFVYICFKYMPKLSCSIETVWVFAVFLEVFGHVRAHASRVDYEMVGAKFRVKSINHEENYASIFLHIEMHIYVSCACACVMCISVFNIYIISFQCRCHQWDFPVALPRLNLAADAHLDVEFIELSLIVMVRQRKVLR